MLLFVSSEAEYVFPRNRLTKATNDGTLFLGLILPRSTDTTPEASVSAPSQQVYPVVLSVVSLKHTLPWVSVPA